MVLPKRVTVLDAMFGKVLLPWQDNAHRDDDDGHNPEGNILIYLLACFWFIMGFSLPTIMTSVQTLQDTMQADIHAVLAARKMCSFQKSSSSPTL